MIQRGRRMHYYSLSEWILFFFIYCFLGWVWESCYVSYKQKQWVNRGFMHGPLLPIYGTGAISILFLTIPVQKNMVLVFIFGMIGATLLEYVTGVLMEALFHMRYWDYSDKPFNIKGHICLLSSLAWGCFSILLIKVLHQNIEALIGWLEYSTKEILALVLIGASMVDFIQSFQEAMDLKEILMQLSETNRELQMLRRRLDVVMAIVDTDTTKLKERLLQSKLAVEEKFIGERKKYEEALKEQLERSKESRSRYKMEIESYLEKITKEKSLALQLLSDKVGNYLMQIELHTKEIGIHPAEELDKVKLELEGMKEKIKKQKEKGFDLKQKAYVRSMKILHRNPHTVSKRYEEALKEVKEAKN